MKRKKNISIKQKGGLKKPLISPQEPRVTYSVTLSNGAIATSPQDFIKLESNRHLGYK
jgi:hypothetical protein